MKRVALPIILGHLALAAASCEESRDPVLPESEMKDKATDAETIPEGHETITLGGGCFWCVEAVYQKLDGVHSAESGYMGGHVANPTYEQVCSKTTGHVEVVRLRYDPETISTEDILAWFWEIHDPTSRDRQGADAGPQYRSVIFCHTGQQGKIAAASKEAAQKRFEKPIVTEIRKAGPFYKAEPGHQDFYFRNKSYGYCRAVIQPKLEKLNLDR